MPKTNLKRLGDYIQLVDERNTALENLPLMGLSISKEFIPSVANIIGTDLKNYKVVRKKQFACSLMQVSRDGKIPIAMLNQEKVIMSPAYPIFEVIDPQKLDPDYLMMWFSRSEFDRQAAYYAVGGVRGNLPWEDFCEISLPVPHIDKQRAIVKEYKTVQDRINLNQQIIQKLEETAQAVYKQWFVEFEFPNEKGKPYKSNGGKMVWCEELGKEIPVGWKVGKLGKLVNVINGYAFSSDDFSEIGSYPIIKIANIVSPNIEMLNTKYYEGKINNRMQSCLVKQDDILISMTGSHMNQINSAVGKIGRYNYEYPALLNQRVGKIKPKTRCNEFIYQTMLQEDIKTNILMAATGSANQANISPDTIKNVIIVLPIESILSSYEDIITKMRGFCSNYGRQNRGLIELKELLLSKLATVEVV